MTAPARTHHSVNLELSDEEWMSIIVADRDGLPTCCANVSTLRDTMISIARTNGHVSPFNNIEMRLGWVYPEHGEPTPVMSKVIEQLGITLAVIEDEGHEPQEPEHP